MIKRNLQTGIGLMLFFMASCHPASQKATELKRFLGSTVDFPENIAQRFSKEKAYFLVIYLKAEECIPCALNKVTLLGHYKSDFEKFSTEIILITKEDGNKEQIKTMFSEMGINYPLLFDREDGFLTKNPVISSNRLCRAFIVDRKMKVIWIGSPVETAKSMERYREMMKLFI
jgi:hypothetical protein